MIENVTALLWSQAMDFKLPPLIFVIFSLSIAQSVHTATNGASHMAKKAQKNFNNYASVECGAKILAANPEAEVSYIWYYILLRNLSGDDIMTNKSAYWFENLFLAEHFSHIDGEHGLVHAKPL